MMNGHPYIPKDWPPGKWTDDTQLTLAMSRALRSAKTFNMDTMVREHIAEMKISAYGWGSATRDSIRRLMDGTHTWKDSGSKTAKGNGVLMKIAPLALYWASVYGPGHAMMVKLEQITELTFMTHATFVVSFASALAFCFSKKKKGNKNFFCCL
jgi:ADP-ribosylglycohydrolase